MCYHDINFNHRISFFFPFVSMALYSGVRYGVPQHHKYRARLSISPKNLNEEHRPEAEPFGRCYGGAGSGFHPPWTRIQPCTHPQGMYEVVQPPRWVGTQVRRLNLHRDFIRVSARGEMLLQRIWSLCGEASARPPARGLSPRAGDEVVAWWMADAGALALRKVAEGINQGRISLARPWRYLLLWKVSKLWLHNYDSFPQASVSTI